MSMRSNRWLTLFLCVLLSSAAAAVSTCQRQAAQEPRSPVTAAPSVVTVDQVEQWMDRGDPIAILDSRSGDAWNSSTTKAAGALRVPPTDVVSYLGQIPRDRKIIVYCT